MMIKLHRIELAEPLEQALEISLRLRYPKEYRACFRDTYAVEPLKRFKCTLNPVTYRCRYKLFLCVCTPK